VCPTERSIYVGTLPDTPGPLAISDLDLNQCLLPDKRPKYLINKFTMIDQIKSI
jgi:hypothetical protein